MRRIGTQRRARGSTMLMSLGFITVMTVGVMVSLRSVNTEAQMQGQERRRREAFFAAEAGLAEGREALRILLGTDNRYAVAMAGLPVFEAPGHPSAAGNEWLELIEPTPYSMTVGTAVSESEVADYRSYPEQPNVTYQVFVVDDDDEEPSDRTADSNGRVWVVSSGQVASNGDGLPTRVVVRALVTNSNAPASSNCYGQKGGCFDNNFSYDSAGVPNVASAITF